MSEQVVVTGIILSSMSIGDYDKRIVILTKEFGKISAFAKGARRHTSPLLSVCQQFAFGEFSLYQGKTSYSVCSGDIKNYFQEIKQDLDSIYYASYFCELLDYVTRENNDEINILKLFYQTLKALSYKKVKNELIRYIFEVKVLAYCGVGLHMFSCIKCGKKEDLFYFHQTGILCEDCAKKINESVRLNKATIYTLQYILSSNLTELYTFNVSDIVLKELKMILEYYMNIYIDKKFKTLEFIL